jgi:hypothetical protein
MDVAMYVLRELEDAVDGCEKGCGPEEAGECDDDPVGSVDEAVAFYTGSLEASDEGQFFYTLAEKRCENFRTCGEKQDSKKKEDGAHVNMEIMKEFAAAKVAIEGNQCELAFKAKDRIAQLMTIPLIQGTLRYAWKTSKGGDQVQEAEGVAFAASVLPWINKCNPTSATTIAENMKIGQDGTADFGAVKNAFEATYSCLGITCADVGGVLVEGADTYETGAEPCKSGSILASLSLVAGIAATAVAALMM